MLPIWDRLPKDLTRVYRLQTDDGERLLGRVVPEESIGTVLTRLGMSAQSRTYSAAEIVTFLAAGTHKVELANGWYLKSSRVSGEQRFELVGPDFTHKADVERDGVFWERIDWKGRWFVPTGSEAAAVIERLTKARPVAQVVGLGRAA